jgi:hypothetical protein
LSFTIEQKIIIKTPKINKKHQYYLQTYNTRILSVIERVLCSGIPPVNLSLLRQIACAGRWRRMPSWSVFIPTGRVVLGLCGPLFIVACWYILPTRLFHLPSVRAAWSLDSWLCVALSQLDIPFLLYVLDCWTVMMIGQLESSAGSSGLDS